MSNRAINHPHAALDHWASPKASGLDETAVLISSVPCNLFGYELQNENANPVYLQCFNASDAGDVTVGTNEPDAVFKVPEEGGGGRDPQAFALKYFSKGLVVACTSDRFGATSPGASAPHSNIWFKK